jgi:hypothetical protein
MGVLEAALYRKVHYSGIPAFDRGCDGKIPHPSEEGARRHAKRIKKAMKKRFDVYLCNFCHHFHVGTRRPDPSMRVAASRGCC